MMTVHLVASYFAGRAEPFIATRTSARQQYLNINRQDTSRHDTTRHDTTRRRGVETQYTCKSKTQLLTILHRCSNATLCEFQLMVTLHLIKYPRSTFSRRISYEFSYPGNITIFRVLQRWPYVATGWSMRHNKQFVRVKICIDDTVMFLCNKNVYILNLYSYVMLSTPSNCTYPCRKCLST
ncbi:uncharacterized protein LOC110836826 isoform X1 [Zootermopsis nevadensis]|uniref:uncharacterized protein LOC110836826 isoform X1 n=1 Tax=Zootermopsis nevadensis TaxID=136037 RepID=UPI000B8E511C|nr:uncharacterized protein LOC110836826 isoform X1 [Zootermopsis nevadensis]